MKSIDDGTGMKSDRVKLIRSESIGSYSWDTTNGSVNYGNGINEWSESDLMKLLNLGYESESIGGSLYWNSKTGTCYAGYNNSTVNCDFTNIGINDKLKSLIGDAVWNIESPITNEQITSVFYSNEQSTQISKICPNSQYCNDSVVRTIKWTGKVGLMYPSDYGYATSSKSKSNRAFYLNTNLSSWNSYSDCYNNDWMYKNGALWTITPYASSSHASNAFYVFNDGSVSGYNVIYTTYSVYPAVYLSSNVFFSSGNGSIDNPFIPSL